MKKVILFIVAFLVAWQISYADSSFLPGLEFHYLYQNNKFIFGTSENGVSEKEYLDFLLSKENPLGEKAALISALASYFEWIDVDDNPNNDNEDYFREYTRKFKQVVLKKYGTQNKIPASLRLLEALMDDFGTDEPNVKLYDQLALEMPNSLTMQSILVTAFGYDILYNEKWDKVSDYEINYVDSYKKNWGSYDQDIDPEVHTKVEEWIFYIYGAQSKNILESNDEIREEEPEPKNEITLQDESTSETYTDEDGSEITIFKSAEGEYLGKTVVKTDIIKHTMSSMQYIWDKESVQWDNYIKIEGTFNNQNSPVLVMGYRWNKDKNKWQEEEKQEFKYKYDKKEQIKWYSRSFYIQEKTKWVENYREEMELNADGESISGKAYKRENGKLILVEEFPSKD